MSSAQSMCPPAVWSPTLALQSETQASEGPSDVENALPASHPRSMKDYRPAALTSHIMMTREHLILHQPRPMVSTFLDPLQLAYLPQLSVKDAIILQLTSLYTHLDQATSSARIMFFF